MTKDLTPTILREMRAEMNRRFDDIATRLDGMNQRIHGVEAAIGDLRTDIKELSLRTALMEVRTGKTLERIDRIEASRLDSQA